MTVRECLREELRPAAGDDTLGDIMLEEALRIVDLTNEGLGQELPDGGEAAVRALHGDAIASVAESLRQARERVQRLDYDSETAARAVFRKQVRERALKESTES